MTYFCSDKHISALAIAICDQGLSGFDPISTALRLRHENLEAYRLEHPDFEPPEFKFIEQDVTPSDALAAAYYYRAQTQGLFSEPWTRDVMLQVGVTRVKDSLSLLEHLMPQLTRIEGFAESLMEYAKPDPSVSDTEIKGRKRGNSLDF